MGPLFVRHGYELLYLFRHGDGLSGGQSVPAGDRMDQALAAQGKEARNRLQLQLLEHDELDEIGQPDRASPAFERRRPIGFILRAVCLLDSRKEPE